MNKSNLVRYVRDPKTGQLVAVPAGRVLLNNIEPGMGRTTSPGMNPMTGSKAMADLYARLPDADIAGAIGPGVVPGGEQARGARRGQAEQEDQPPPPATFRPLGGAKQNFRGNTREVTIFGDGLGGPITTLTPTIVQTPRDAGDDAEGIIVSLGAVLGNPEPSELNAQSFAIITTALLTWGIGGAIFEAEMDWNQGTMICLPASYASVAARVEATQQASPGVTSATLSLLLSAGLAYGTPNSARMASPARKTTLVGVLTAGATSSVGVIPLWANSVTLVSSSLAPDLTISLQPQGNTNANATVFQVIGCSNDQNNNEHQFPIPSGCRYFTITNNTGGNLTGVKAVFNLAF